MTVADPSQDLRTRGWTVFDPTPDLLAWVDVAEPLATRLTQDPELQATWLQCEGTWFVGVDVLPTDKTGALDAVPLRGPFGPFLPPTQDWHPAQLSVTYPGYPRPRTTESAAAFRYRLGRDAAHVDGVLAEGPARRRFVREPHGFILGIALNDAPPDAAPLVVWDGSHMPLQRAFASVLAGAEAPEAVDVTEVYTTARAHVFETCARVPVPLARGQAVLLHPLLLHGVAPWQSTGHRTDADRKIAYFRPILLGGIQDWLQV